MLCCHTCRVYAILFNAGRGTACRAPTRVQTYGDDMGEDVFVRCWFVGAGLRSAPTLKLPYFSKPPDGSPQEEGVAEDSEGRVPAERGREDAGQGSGLRPKGATGRVVQGETSPFRKALKIEDLRLKI